MGKTREALFSMLEARGFPWEGARVLDLFAGSGSLGFECLSRGAREAMFVESGAAQCRCLHKNAMDLDLLDRIRIRRQDVGRFLRGMPDCQYNLIFLDPPYGRNLVTPALNSLLAGNWLAPGAILIAEIEKQTRPNIPAALGEPEKRNFGQTILNIWSLP